MTYFEIKVIIMCKQPHDHFNIRILKILEIGWVALKRGFVELHFFLNSLHISFHASPACALIVEYMLPWTWIHMLMLSIC